MRRSKTGLYLLLVLLFLAVGLLAGYIYLSSRAAPTEQGEVIPPGLFQPTPVPKIRVLVANQVVPAEVVLDAEAVARYFEAREIERTEVSVGELVGHETMLIGKITRVQIEPQSILYANQFVEATLSHFIPKGKRAVPLQVDRFSGVVGRPIAGDHVDIVFSGQVEMHLPQSFPLSFEEVSPMVGPIQLLAVKTILQDIEILEVIPLTTSVGTPQAAPTPEGAQPATPLQPLEWIFILAVEDQQAEILKFAQDQGMTYQLLLRGRGDRDAVDTRGVTTQILLETYGLPRPELIPYTVRPGDLPRGIVP